MPTNSSNTDVLSEFPWRLAKCEQSCPALPGLPVYSFQRGTDETVQCVAQTDLDALYSRYPGLKKLVAKMMKTRHPDHKRYFKTKPFENRADFQACFSNNATNGKCLIPTAVVSDALKELNLENAARRESISTFVAKMNQQEKKWALMELANAIGVELSVPAAAASPKEQLVQQQLRLQQQQQQQQQLQQQLLLQQQQQQQQQQLQAGCSSTASSSPVSGFYESFARQRGNLFLKEREALVTVDPVDSTSESVGSDSNDMLFDSPQKRQHEQQQQQQQQSLVDIVAQQQQLQQEQQTLTASEDDHKRKRTTMASMFDLPGSPLDNSLFGVTFGPSGLCPRPPPMLTIDNNLRFDTSTDFILEDRSPQRVEQQPHKKQRRLSSSAQWSTNQQTQPFSGRSATILPPSPVMEMDGGYELMGREGSLLFGARASSSSGASTRRGSTGPTVKSEKPASLASRIWSSAVDKLLPEVAASTTTTTLNPRELHRRAPSLVSCDPFGDVKIEPTDEPTVGRSSSPALSSTNAMRLDGVVRCVRSLRAGRGMV